MGPLPALPFIECVAGFFEALVSTIDVRRQPRLECGLKVIDVATEMITNIGRRLFPQEVRAGKQVTMARPVSWPTPDPPQARLSSLEGCFVEVLSIAREYVFLNPLGCYLHQSFEPNWHLARYCRARVLTLASSLDHFAAIALMSSTVAFGAKRFRNLFVEQDSRGW